MRATLLTILLALSAAPLVAQTVDTLGGTNNAPSRTNTSKASLFRVDSTVLLTEYEMYLNATGPTPVTWFVHRYHSRAGIYTLEWSQTATLNGTGAGWYTTGPIALPLVEGNHYMIGLAWAGTLTYHYSTSSVPFNVSFGSWQRAMTPGNPVPTSYNVAAGIDTAVYHQRLTTLPFPAVDIVGTSCAAGALLPRLVASQVASRNLSTSFQLVDATPNTLGVYALALGHTTAVPTPMFGCDLWIDLLAPVATTAVITSAAGFCELSFAIPNDPLLTGVQISAQCGVLSTGIDITNALDLVIQ